MAIKEKVNTDLKEAMKSGDAFRRDTLRLLTAAFKQTEVDSRKELSDDDVMSILKKEAKRRQESIVDLEKAGRDAAQEKKELALIETYLPAQMDKAQIEAIARQVIAETGATTAKDVGGVMKELMPRLQGQADGKVVSQVVRELLP